MSDVFNAIRPGFPFSQDFETDAGAIVDGAQLWLNLRRVTRPAKAAVVTGLFLARISPTLFRLTLTALQSSMFSDGAVEGDLIQRLAGIDTPIGLRITIPVAEAV